jgi:hypothetical protein
MCASRLRIVFSFFILVLWFNSANAIEIREVTSPGGIAGW